MAPDPEKFVSQITKEIRDRNPRLIHPLWKMFLERKLPVGAVRLWARQHYAFLYHAPMIISRVHSRCLDIEFRKMLAENIATEELGMGDPEQIPHIELWIRTCEGLGISREELAEDTPLPETMEMINWLYECADRSFVDGVTAINFTLESVVPDIYKEQYRIFRDHYKLDDRALLHFRVHMRDDVEHGNFAKRVITRYAASAEDQRRIREVVERTLAAEEKMLDAVYRQGVLSAQRGS